MVRLLFQKNLPVLLPYITDYKPEGRGPLGKVDSYMNTVCPICGKPARRDPDTLDTFMCSTWYQLRYPCNHDDKEIFNREKVNKILPVDTYVGGVEHATSHLLYSRFITKFLRDIGCLDFDEPFKRLIHQGMVLGPDGKKMSKRNSSKTADDYINEFGSDALRLHMMFSMNYIDGGLWKDEGLKHMKAFMERVERIVLKWKDAKGNKTELGKDEKDLLFVFNNTVKEMTTSFEVLSFNSAIARYMELINAMFKYDTVENKNPELCKDIMKKAVILLAPAAPHFCEELWEMIGEKYSVHNQKWPSYDEKYLVKSVVEIAVQVNSKIITKLDVDTSLSNQDVLNLVKSDAKIAEILQGKTIVKEIVVPGRLVNLIVK